MRQYPVHVFTQPCPFFFLGAQHFRLSTLQHSLMFPLPILYPKQIQDSSTVLTEADGLPKG